MKCTIYIDESLAHSNDHKYIDRFKGKNGKWQYVYQENKRKAAKAIEKKTHGIRSYAQDVKADYAEYKKDKDEYVRKEANATQKRQNEKHINKLATQGKVSVVNAQYGKAKDIKTGLGYKDKTLERIKQNRNKKTKTVSNAVNSYKKETVTNDNIGYIHNIYAKPDGTYETDKFDIGKTKATAYGKATALVNMITRNGRAEAKKVRMKDLADIKSNRSKALAKAKNGDYSYKKTHPNGGRKKNVTSNKKGSVARRGEGLNASNKNKSSYRG